MTDPYVVKYQFLISRELLEEAKAKAREDDLKLAQVVRGCLRRYVVGELELIRTKGNHEA